MRISIITPSFQQAEWLPACLRSVEAQTRPADEHLVWDGASTDGSIDVLDKWARASGRAYRSQPDDGQSDALNRLWEWSSGDIVGWVNSDDMLADRRTLQWVGTMFEENSAVDVVYGDAVVVDRDGRFMQYLPAPAFNHDLLRAYNFLVQPAVFLRRTAVDRLKGFVDARLDYVFDRDLWLRLANDGATFHALPRPLAVDRHRPGRKVLHDALRDELEQLDARHGGSSHLDRSWPTRKRRILNRLGGASAAMSLESVLDPVPGLELGSPAWRAYAQLARPWARAVA